MPTVIERQIYYHDTDAGGVVYYANYLKYMEEARTQWFEDHGLPVGSFLKRGLLYAVRSCNILYRSPARYGEVICCDTELEKMTGVKLFFHQKVWEKNSDRSIAEADIVLACLSKELKPRPIPKDMRERIK